MRRFCPYLLIGFVFLLFSAKGAWGTEIATSSATVTATVPRTSVPAGPDSIPPSAPILLRPLDGWTTSDPTPEFVWRKSLDPNSNYVAYTVYLNGVAKYLGVSNLGNAAGAGYTSEVDSSEVRLIPTIALPEGTYYWKVAAYDAAGNLAYSTQWTLVIDTTPPPLTVTDLDTYHELTLSSLNPSSINPSTTFTVTGPKDVYFTILTEPYTAVSLTLIASDGSLLGPVVGTTGSSPLIKLYRHLDLGRYTVGLAATDKANLTTLLAPFTLIVNQSLITLPIPGVSPPPQLVVPRQLVEISSLLYNYPSTIARIATRASLAAIYVGSIALVLVVLLIFLKRRANLFLVNSHDTPLPSAQVLLPAVNKVYSLRPRNHGKLYIASLKPHVELSIEYNGLTTHLCLLTHKNLYTIAL